MAHLEHVQFTPWREDLIGNELGWRHDRLSRVYARLPQIYWENGDGWAEANLWALDKLSNQNCDIETAKGLMKHLYAYACFLEENSLDWRHFPIRLEERAVVRFRGHLIKERDQGRLAPSTARARMSAVIQFYRYSASNHFVTSKTPMWRERIVVIPYFDSAGFKRALTRLSTDLAIPNRSRSGVTLEDGLLPLSDAHMDSLLEFAVNEETPELHLMLTIGFFTGARLCTISTLKIENLEKARPDPYVENFHLIRVGPGTGVATKFNVEGELLIPDTLLQALKDYAYSTSRLKREARAQKNDKSILFLTSRGRRYQNSTVGVLMTNLRRKGLRSNLKFLENFKFHQSRATYGTWVMKIVLSVTNTAAAIEFVKSAMLHKHESTTFRYVKFLEVSEGKQRVAKQFHEAFTGLQNRDWNKFNA